MLRAELAWDQTRFRAATRASLSVVAAVGASLFGQIASPYGVMFVAMILQPTVVSTWSNMFRRIASVGLGLAIALPLIGAIVQTSWLVVPVFWFAVTASSYVIPFTHHPVSGYIVQLAIVTTVYDAILEPARWTETAWEIFCTSTIGIVVATVLARTLWPESPVERMNAAFRDELVLLRRRLRDAVSEYLADAPPTAPQAPALTLRMPALLNLLDLARQEGLAPDDDAIRVAWLTALERLALSTESIEVLAREPSVRKYRRLIRPEVERLCGAIDRAIVAYEAQQPGRERSDDPTSESRSDGTADDPTWSALERRLAELEERQAELRVSGETSTFDPFEIANTNGLIDALRDLVRMLRVPPTEFERVASGAGAGRVAKRGFELHYDPIRMTYALKVGLATTLAFVYGCAAQRVELTPALWSCIFVAQTSLGATIRRAGPRIVGSIVGGALALMVVILVLPNLSDPANYLLVLGLVSFPFFWVGRGTSTVSYGAFTAVTTFLICAMVIRPSMDVYTPIWRLYATVLGIALLYVSFELVAPDWAGRQLAAKVRSMLAAVLEMLPPRGEPAKPVRAIRFATRRIISDASDSLRLADEARYEGRGSGIDPDAAIHAAGLSRRIGQRISAVVTSRAEVPRPPLPAEAAARLDALEAALRERLSRAVEEVALLEARAQMRRGIFWKRTGGPRIGRAMGTAGSAGSPRRPAGPDVEGPLRELADGLARIRYTALAPWGLDAAGGLFAELDHFRRVVELLPQLETSLREMVTDDVRA